MLRLVLIVRDGTWAALFFLVKSLSRNFIVFVFCLLKNILF